MHVASQARVAYSPGRNFVRRNEDWTSPPSLPARLCAGQVEISWRSSFRLEECLCIGMPKWHVEHVETAAGAQLRCELLNGGHGHQCRGRSDGDACNAHALECFRIGHAGSPRDVDGRTDGFDEGCNSGRIAQPKWINAIRACGEVGLTALDGRVKARALFAMLEVEDIAPGVE